MDEEVSALAERVRVIPDSALPDKDIVHCRMTVQMKSGKIHETEVHAPLGNPANALDMPYCKEKFTKCLSHSNLDFDDQKAAKLLSMIEDLEAVQDVSLITSLIRA